MDFSSDTDIQQEIVKNAPSEDVNKFLLATSEFGQEIHEEINLYVTNNRLNEASFRQKLDPISKNIIKNQNPVDLLFKDLKHFDTQNPVEMLFKDLKHCDTQNSVIDNLIREVDIGKK